MVFERAPPDGAAITIHHDEFVRAGFQIMPNNLREAQARLQEEINELRAQQREARLRAMPRVILDSDAPPDSIRPIPRAVDIEPDLQNIIEPGYWLRPSHGRRRD